MVETARTAGLDLLYHYEKFNTAYLKDILLNQRVYCSDPASLNDPWDCRPWFDEGVVEDPQAVDELLSFFFKSNPGAPVSEAEKDATRRHAKVNRDYTREILNRFSENFLTMIPNRWRIYCLTPVPNSTLMWSHYADNHKGICLEFATGHPLFGSAQKVQYLSSYPKWSPQSLLLGGAQRVLLIKSDDWKYEREYRIVGLGDGIARPIAHPLVLTGNFLALPGGILQAVIAGCESDYEAISELVKTTAPALKVKRAVRARSEYRLEIVE